MLTRRQILAAVAATAVLPAANVWAQNAEPLPDMILGDPDAPIEIIEYSSMTCPHCAAFHTETYPTLKEEYFDTGRAKLVFREFPLDRIALAVSAIARCSGEDRFFPFVDVMFQTQEQWARSSDPLGEIKSIIRMGGQDPAMVDECLADDSIINGILAVRLHGSETYDIASTPTFIINGESHPSNMSFEEFDTLLREIEGYI